LPLVGQIAALAWDAGGRLFTAACHLLTRLRETHIASDMHTVCETHSFQRAAKDAGMSTDEIADLINYLAVNPMAGDEMAGTGGCRKLRVAGRGKGKSGGYRTITFYSGQMMPVFLITVFSKGEKANLTKAERNQLALLTGAIISDYKKRIVKVSVAQ
jgi:hypothetical protein